MMDNVRRTKIVDLEFYTEGPVMDKDGDFYCTTLTGGMILKINRCNEIAQWGRSACPNGQIILPGGDHLICDSALAAVRRFDHKGRFLKNEIECFCSDLPIHTPNDLVTDEDGNLYFTDSIRHTGKVCFLGVNGEQRVLATNLDYPNGLVLSADGNVLYVAESYKNRIIKFNLKKPVIAELGFEVFADLPKNSSGREDGNLPDGLAIDRHGNLYVAHYGMQAIHVLSATGNLLNSIDTSMPYTSNVTFVDHQSLLVTGGYGEPGPGALFLIQGLTTGLAADKITSAS